LDLVSLVVEIWKVRKVARRIVVSDEKIEAWNYGGKHISLLWSDLREVRQIDLIAGIRNIKVMRLVPREGLEEIILVGLMLNFSNLIHFVYSHAPHAKREGKLTLAERLIRWGL
jgi:hypothetical protein